MLMRHPQNRQRVTHNLFVGGKNKLMSTALQEPEEELPLPPESKGQLRVNFPLYFYFMGAFVLLRVFIPEDLLG